MTEEDLQSIRTRLSRLEDRVLVAEYALVPSASFAAALAFYLFVTDSEGWGTSNAAWTAGAVFCGVAYWILRKLGHIK